MVSTTRPLTVKVSGEKYEVTFWTTKSLEDVPGTCYECYIDIDLGRCFGVMVDVQGTEKSLGFTDWMMMIIREHRGEHQAHFEMVVELTKRHLCDPAIPKNPVVLRQAVIDFFNDVGYVVPVGED